MTFQDWLNITTLKQTNAFLSEIFRPRIWCKDGFNFSVQGNEYSYCLPRIYTNKYECMEIGYPSEKEELLELLDYDGDGVYGYVSIEIIKKIINKHGGIDVYKTFEQHKNKYPNIQKFLRKDKLKRILDET
jgi:hypothetical protein